MFPLFGKISWRKKWLNFISEIKNKIRRTGMRNIYPVFQPPVHSFNWGHGEFYVFIEHHSFYTGYTTICKDFYPLNGRRRTLPVHHIYLLLDLKYMIPADIILSWVMIKPDYTVWEDDNDADQPAHLQSNKHFFVSCFDSIVHVIMITMSRSCEIRSVRVVSKCSLLQHDVAHFCAPWMYYRTDRSGVDQ